MENRGYEDEHLTSTIINPNSALPPREIYAIDVSSTRDETDVHVYEDIAVFGPENSITADRSSIFSLPTNSTDKNTYLLDESKVSKRSNIVGLNSNSSLRFAPKDLPKVSLSAVDFDGRSNFHRNLTLPFPVPNGIIDQPANDTIRSSVRVTDAEKNGFFSHDVISSSLHEGSVATSRIIDESTTATMVVDSPVVDKTGRRRRKKKDCKHCRNKTNASRVVGKTSIDLAGNSTMPDEAAIFPADVFSGCQNSRIIEHRRKMGRGCEPIQDLPDGRLANFNLEFPNRIKTPSTNARENYIFSMDVIPNDLSFVKPTKNIDDDGKTGIDLRLDSVELNDHRTLTRLKDSSLRNNRDDCMRINSIYSQEHWYCREDSPIFVTDAGEQKHFQRAYSLPAKSQSPSSQNRVNLRKSARDEPPPHLSRLRKNRHGWTFDFSRPLDATGCTRSIIFLLTAILVLLGIGGIALYIVFEPEKLQIIQQYLRSSSSLTVSMETEDEFDGNSMSLETEPTDTTKVSTANVLLNEDIYAFTRRKSPYSKTHSEIVSTATSAQFDVNVTRHCDDCYDGEVCVALVDEEVPFCRTGSDPQDPTGCAGLCLINKQKCHRLDVDAFRCVKVDNYCLDDEWMCSNTLCIRLSSHCDGHMNCYDHSDEYNCACNLQTHFRCGNETSCLPLGRMCDGKIDCWDANDEINCTRSQDLGWSCPSIDDFTCSNGECIVKARFCDGLRDCTDGSDEPQGCQGRCNKHEFSCRNGRCITKSMRCNGMDNCGDNSDEQYCKYMIKR